MRTRRFIPTLLGSWFLGLLLASGAASSTITLHHATATLQKGLVAKPDSLLIIFTDLRDKLNAVLPGAGVVEVYNGTGSALAAGDLVFINTYNSGSGNPSVAKAVATQDTSLARLVITEAIASAASGDASGVYLQGSQTTTGAHIGDAIYLSASSAGTWTLTRPTGTSRTQIVGRVETVSASSGRVVISLPGSPYLNEFLTAAELDTGSVGTSEVLDETLTAGDIDTSAVATSEILDETISAADIDTNAVDASEIAADAVGSSEIASGAVTTDEVLDETLTAADLDTSSVASSEVLDESLTAADIDTGAVGTSEVEDNSLTADDIAASAIGDSELGAIDSTWVGADALSMPNIKGLEESEWNELTDAGSTTLHTHPGIDTTRTMYLEIPFLVADGRVSSEVPADTTIGPQVCFVFVNGDTDKVWFEPPSGWPSLRFFNTIGVELTISMSTAATADTTEWALDAYAVKAGEDASSTTPDTTITGIVIANNAVDYLATGTLGPFNANIFEAGDRVVFGLWRDGGHAADNHAGKARLHRVRLYGTGRFNNDQ